MKLIAKNKKAYFNYDIEETYEAGISLTGSEVKAVRKGRVSLKESYADLRDGEIYLIGCHISQYEPASRLNHEPTRDRKLLMHRREIKRLTGKIKERGFTLVPTKLFITGRGWIKVEVALAKGKKIHQKREAIRERDRERDMQAELKRYRR